VLALVLALWGAWLWAWAGWSVVARYGWYTGDTELRIIAAYFVALGIPPLLVGIALWRDWNVPAGWVALGCLALLAFWSQQLVWVTVELVTGLRTGTWSDPLEALAAWHWFEQLIVVPQQWSDLGFWMLWYAWGFWSQPVVAFIAFVQALRKRPLSGLRRQRAAVTG
jgi:hypothetical protein